MIKTLHASIIDALNNFSFKDTDTIYVLSGFNYFLDSLDIELALPMLSFLASKEEKEELNKQLVGRLIASNGRIVILREDLVYVKGLIEALGKKIVVINNDIYTEFVPNFKDSEISNSIAGLFDAESDVTSDDGAVQKAYDEIIEIRGVQFVRYSDIGIDESNFINISSLIDIPSYNLDESIQLPEDVDAERLTEVIHHVVCDNVGIIYSYEEALTKNARYLQFRKVLESIGVDFRAKSYTGPNITIPEDRKNSYLEILHRRNPEYGFRYLEVYKNPYESNDLMQIGQEIIIDDIVKNSLKAREEKMYNDVFVTAPTGAGKSVMFQIPAIYLAEKYNLVTIVVSPLIALMNDQVNNIIDMTDQAVAINGSYTPSEKEEAINKIKNNEKSILYLAPEALLSHANIEDLVGERKIGLMVIDEAHVVATWGKNFRPDCWYLGDYLNRLRKGTKATQNFPIVTFTATATFGTNGSMYDDITNSLYMTPNKYIGCARRDDITFDVRVRESESGAYKEEKDDTAVKSIKELILEGAKSIVYTPYKSQTDLLYTKLYKTDAVCRYYSGLSDDEKDESYRGIKDGSKKAVICTKAFGMGVDVSDIKYVYHYAPTGTIADYVQEIGRAARLPGMIGVAKTDYFKTYDFKYINQLYGMSSIRNDQIIQCISKILNLYQKSGHRNFLASSEDFAYIFGGNSSNENERIADVDNKLKTALLMIKKDFEVNPATHDFEPVKFKPRSLFVYGYFAISDEFFSQIQKAGYGKYFRNVTKKDKFVQIIKGQSPITVTYTKKTYELNYRKMWEERYRWISFADFKRRFNMNLLGELTNGFNFKVGEELGAITIVNAKCKKYKAFAETQAELCEVIDKMKEVLDYLKQQGKFFTAKELAKILRSYDVTKSIRVSEALSSIIINVLPMLKTHSVVSDGSFIVKKKNTGIGSNNESYRISNNSYISRLADLKRATRMVVSEANTISRFFPKSEMRHVIIFQLLDALELANVEMKAGDRPEYFFRVNNPTALERIINDDNYYSYSVRLARQKHEMNREMMRHLFEDLEDDVSRWGFIENYFLGQLDEKKFLPQAQE